MKTVVTAKLAVAPKARWPVHPTSGQAIMAPSSLAGADLRAVFNKVKLWRDKPQQAAAHIELCDGIMLSEADALIARIEAAAKPPPVATTNAVANEPTAAVYRHKSATGRERSYERKRLADKRA